MIEFQLLTGPELRLIDPRQIPWPDDTFGIAAYKDGKVVGITTITNLPVVEGTWLDDSMRGSTLGPRLFAKIEELYRSLGKTHALALSPNKHPEIADYLKRLDFKHMPVSFYQKDLTEKQEVA